jgi:hypothetical protein
LWEMRELAKISAAAGYLKDQGSQFVRNEACARGIDVTPGAELSVAVIYIFVVTPGRTASSAARYVHKLPTTTLCTFIWSSDNRLALRCGL